MNDSNDQYGNHKSTYPKMLMDCIQYAVVIRANSQADTYRDRKSSLGLHEKRLHISERGWQTIESRRRGPGKFFQHPAAEKRHESPSRHIPILSSCLSVPPKFALVLSMFFLFLSKIILSPTETNQRQCKLGDVCLRRSHHQRVGTCTKREYPRSLLSRALRKTQLYTLSII